MKKEFNKKLLGLLLVPILVVAFFLGKNLFFGQKARLSKVDIKSKNIYIYNLTKGEEVFGVNEEERVAPASLTKILTVLVAVENIEDLSKIAPIDKESYQEMVARNSSMAGFYGNEPTTYEDLLYGTMLASGGECANSLAINISGTTEEFTNLMNVKVKEMGLENTNFQNPEGMDGENHYSTAKDVSKTLKYALENKEFKTVFTTKEFVSTPTLNHPEGVIITSTVLGKLDNHQKDGFTILGGKSGTTENAGVCWATLVVKNDEEYICVVMGAPKDEEVEYQIQDTLNLIDEL